MFALFFLEVIDAYILLPNLKHWYERERERRSVYMWCLSPSLNASIFSKFNRVEVGLAVDSSNHGVYLPERHFTMFMPVL